MRQITEFDWEQLNKKIDELEAITGRLTSEQEQLNHRFTTVHNRIESLETLLRDRGISR